MNVGANEPLFLGIDAGGTSCRARLGSAGGRILGEGRAGPASTRFGIEAAFAQVLAAAAAACSAAGATPEDRSRIRAAAGIAGITRGGALDALRALPHPFQSLRFAEDSVIACLGAHRGRDGGILIAGTGSIAYAMVEGREHRFGGYGFPASDEGSGARIGLAALAHALLVLDGRAADTAFSAALLELFGRDATRVIAWCDRASATDYATLAPLVVEHAGTGDAAATGLLREAGSALGRLGDALVAAGAARLAVLGGLGAALRPHLPDGIRARLVPDPGDALEGALILAGRPALSAD